MARPRREIEPPPRVSWDEFTGSLLSGPGRWRQGEHLSAIGPTGTGKTTAVLELLALRADASPKFHTAVLATKPKDSTLNALLRRSWSKLDRWPPHQFDRRVVLWPKWRDPRDYARQRAVFTHAFESMFAAGSWAVFADELSYLSRELKLDDFLRSFWQQGRSLDLTLVGATQRPAWVPLDMYSQATHLLFWRTTDDQDLRRIGGVGGLSSDTIRQTVAGLDHNARELLYVNSRTGAMLRTVAERKVTR